MSASHIPSLLLALLLCTGAQISKGQHLSWQQFTVDHGLPSNKVYDMRQDRNGILWFATDQGIYRFNGYTFSHPADTSNTANNEVLKIEEDPQGRIWFNHLDGSLFFIEDDTIRSWKYNKAARDFANQFRVSLRFAIAKDGTVWIASYGNGFLTINRKGQTENVFAKNSNAILFTSVNKQLLTASKVKSSDSKNAAAVEQQDLHYEIIHLTPEKSISAGQFTRKKVASLSDGIGIWRLNNGDIMAYWMQVFYLIRADKLIWQGRKKVFAKAIWQDTNGAIFLASVDKENKGLLCYRSLEDFQRDAFVNLLPNRSVCAFTVDREGGYWACTIDEGVFYCKNTNLTIFDQAGGLPLVNVSALTNDGQETIFAGQSLLSVFSINRLSGRSSPMPLPVLNTGRYELNWLRFDTLTDRLWAGPSLCFLQNQQWIIPGSRSAHEVVIPPIKRVTPDIRSKQWWASSTFGFYSIDPVSGLCSKIPQSTLTTSTRTFSVCPDREGTLWVTTSAGLRIWGNDTYQDPAFQCAALRFPAQYLERLQSGGMVISLRGSGLLIRDADGQCTHLTTANGLTSNTLTDIDVGPEDIIYACSNAGLNLVTRQTDGTWKIDILTTKHGLPSNLVNDVTWLKGELWVATAKGLARFRQKPTPVSMPAPQLETFRINNQDFTFTDDLVLSHQQSNLSLRFFALHFRSGGDILYRHRLLEADTGFAYTHTREVNFANLKSGRYTFEVQAQNEDGAWSKSALWSFEISPPWWATWWFCGVLIGTFIVISTLFYRNRLKFIQRKAVEREKIRELESAALRAQMNPHFIFNCLQSIQAFITQNDRTAASTYLARFAKLVRLSLHGSIDGRHTLAEEIAMLDCYLHLEQMRFNHKFTFRIHTDAAIDPQEILLPPLLVQPYVENALLHGLQGRGMGGLVEVFFVKNKSVLEVSVCDNGTGATPAPPDSAHTLSHKSVGMLLTQKRLDLLNINPLTTTKAFVLEEIFNENGIRSGSRVRLEIAV